MPLRFNLGFHYSVAEVADLGFKPPYSVSSRITADDMTCDITLKKVSQRPVAPCARHGWRLFPSLYILFIFRCHNMSLRQQALLKGLSCVTLKKQPLSSVTVFPILGTAILSPLSSVLSHHLSTL
jgi:hypothetical protein